MIEATDCTSKGTTCKESTSNISNNNNNVATIQQPKTSQGFVTQQQQEPQSPPVKITATSSSSSSSSHATKTKTTTSPSISSCLPCIQLLQDALLRSDSRPMQLLQRMMSEQKQQQEQIQQQQSRKNINSTTTNDTSNNNNNNLPSDTLAADAAVRWKKSSNGVIVEIPSSSAASLRSSLSNKDSNFDDDDDSPIRTNQQHQLATSAKTKKRVDEKLTEWISLSCKICSSTGPEANARAFVMGPTPLSIVVCQNRLVQTKPNTSTSSSPQYYYATSSSSSSHPQPPEQVVIQQQQSQSQQPKTGYHDRESGINIDSTSYGSQITMDSSKVNSTSKRTSATTSGMMHFTDKQRNEIDEILTHELIHVYDIRQLQLDLRDCQNLAYSEVRAAREAECSKYYRNYNQLSSSLASHPTGTTTTSTTTTTTSHTANGSPETLTATSWSSMFFPSSSSLSDSTAAMANRCVRKKALLATNNLFPVTGKSCIESVFDRAFNDHRPFNAMQQETTNPNPIANTTTTSAPTTKSTINITTSTTETNVTTKPSATKPSSSLTSTTAAEASAVDTTATKESLNLNRALNRYFSIPLSSRTTTTPTASSR